MDGFMNKFSLEGKIAWVTGASYGIGFAIANAFVRLFALVREKVKVLLNGYIPHDMMEKSIEDYIVPPALGEDPGIMGAVKLGMLAGCK